MTGETITIGSEIKTERLQLLPLSTASLQLYLQDLTELEQRMGFPLSQDILTDRLRRAIQMKLEKMRSVPRQDHVWYTYWLLVIAQERFGAGLAGFKGIEKGKRAVEIGYGIDPTYQGKGYTTEAVRALVDWAFSDPECRMVTALEVLKTNQASLRVLEKIGFRISAMREDTCDLVIEKRWFEVGSEGE